MCSKIKKMIAIFNKRQRVELVFLFLIVLLSAVVELLGVSMIIPFINAILQPDELVQNHYVSIFMEKMNIDTDGLIICIAIALIVVYVLKNAYLIFVNRYQLRFTYNGNRELGNRFMRCYLLQDYTFHINHNSAELMRDIATDVVMFYATVLAFIQLMSEGVIAIALVSFLLMKDVIVTIGVAFSLGVMLLLFMGSYKKELVRLGNQRRYYGYKLTQSMQQAFGGIKEIKIAGREQHFLNAFESANAGNTEAMKKNLFLNAIPKPVMEALCIAGLMIVICIRIAMGVNTVDFIGTLAVFAVAAFKLLPSVNKVSGYIGNILHNGVVIDTIYDKVKRLSQLENSRKGIEDKAEYRPVSFENEIMMQAISFRYPQSDNDVLKNASAVIPYKQSIAFIGPSGAGKTTAVDIILGLLHPYEGKVLVDGQDIQDNIDGWRAKIGYIPQSIYMLDDTIRGNVAFGAEVRDDQEIWHALEEAQLKEYVSFLPNGLDTEIGEAGVRLSGGQRQRIGIARALYRKPDILVLDEATSALDNETEAAVMESIEHLQGKLTMIIIAHRLSTIENCDIVYEVNDKTIKRVR